MGDIKGVSASSWQPEAAERESHETPSTHYQIEEPGFAESMVPIWGPAKQAAADFERGCYAWGTFNTALAAVDAIPGVALVKTAGKVGLTGLLRVGYRARGGALKLYKSWDWKQVRSWMGARGWAEYKGQEFHHWLVPQRWYRGNRYLEPIFNQPWNIKRIPENPPGGLTPQRFHQAIHGKSQDKFNALERLWHGSPNWAKGTAASVSGRGVAHTRESNGSTPPRN